ncbi:putative serine/threonine-protein kinase SIS8 [Salvia divinorum]|uniref:Serine/threonine-protein kinase SIS8 n=1 Tax=Salvia divinorum TaxID=28513 RepID=A0ABD1GUC6_SALDI
MEKIVDERIRQNDFEDLSRRKETTNRTCSLNTESLNSKDVSDGQSESQKYQGPAESCGSECGGSSTKSENDLPLVVSFAIQWEDLQLKEEIGQGSFAVVYLIRLSTLLLKRNHQLRSYRMRMYAIPRGIIKGLND